MATATAQTVRFMPETTPEWVRGRHLPDGHWHSAEVVQLPIHGPSPSRIQTLYDLRAEVAKVLAADSRVIQDSIRLGSSSSAGHHGFRPNFDMIIRDGEKIHVTPTVEWPGSDQWDGAAYVTIHTPKKNLGRRRAQNLDDAVTLFAQGLENIERLLSRPGLPRFE